MITRRILTALAVCVAVALSGLAARAFVFSNHNESASPADSKQEGPEITSARLKGKKLIVTGENFDARALILINGEKQKTKRKANGNLVVKKGAERVLPGEPNIIEVQNSDGTVSDKFDLFSGRIITLEDQGKTISLNVGERFLLALERGGYSWTLNFSDQTVLEQVSDIPPAPGSQGIFEAKQAGQVRLSATGELPCHKSTPPCLAATLLFEVNITVQ